MSIKSLILSCIVSVLLAASGVVLPPNVSAAEDCSKYSGDAKTRCEAVNACEEAGGTTPECQKAYDDCVADGGSASDCATEVGGGSADSEANTCQLEGGMGWILCPLMNTVASLTDAAWDTFLKDMLIVPALSTETDAPLFKAWVVMRNIANVLFVAAFLYIIFSQVTSIGISNYGIKKMLPRLIMGAILVNTSYWLAAAAVDVSNVVGLGAYNIITNLAPEVGGGGEARTDWQDAVATVLMVGGVATIIGAATVFPFLIGAAFLVFGVFLTLAFRHAVLLILIVAAPIAAVAYMMPNTDKISKSWWGLFKLLLALFPLMGFVLGASSLASVVIQDVASGSGDSDSAMPLMSVIALFTQAAGILALPFLLKATGGALNRLGVGTPLKGIENAAKKRAGQSGEAVDNRARAGLLKYANNSRTGRRGVIRRGTGALAAIAGGSLGAAAEKRRNLAKSDADTQRTIYEEEGGFMGQEKNLDTRLRENRIIAQSAEKGSAYNDNVEFAEKTDKELKEMAMGSADTFNALKQQRQAALMSVVDSVHSDLSNEKIAKIAGSGQIMDKDTGEYRAATRVELAAATLKTAESGSFNERRHALGYMASHKDSFSSETRKAVVDRAIKNGDNNIYGSSFGNELVDSSGKIDSPDKLTASAVANARDGKVSAEHIIQKAASTEFLVESVRASKDQAAMDNLRTAANLAQSNPTTAPRAGTEEFKKIFTSIGSTPPQQDNPTSGEQANTGTGDSITSTDPAPQTTQNPAPTVVSPATAPSSSSGGPQVSGSINSDVFSRELIKKMGTANVAAAVEKQGGVSSLSDGDVLRLSNTMGSNPVGQAAKTEAYNRNLVEQKVTVNLPTAPTPQQASPENTARQLAPDSNNRLNVPHGGTDGPQGYTPDGATENYHSKMRGE